MSAVTFAASVPPGERIVSMLVFKRVLMVATTTGLYRLESDKLVPVMFVSADHGLVGQAQEPRQ